MMGNMSKMQSIEDTCNKRMKGHMVKKKILQEGAENTGKMK